MESKAPSRAGGHAGAARQRASSTDSPPSSPIETKQGSRSRLRSDVPEASSQTTTSVSLTERDVASGDTAKKRRLTRVVERIVSLATTMPESGRMKALRDAIVAQLEERDDSWRQAVIEGLLDEWERLAGASMDLSAFTDAVCALARAMGGKDMSFTGRAWWCSRLVAMAGNQRALLVGLTFWSVAQAMGDAQIADSDVRELLQAQGDCASVLEPGEMGWICAALADGAGGPDMSGTRGRDMMHALFEESRFGTETLGYMAWALAKVTADEAPLQDTPAKLMLSGDIGAVFTRVLELADAEPPVRVARLVRGVATALEAECSMLRTHKARKLSIDTRGEWWRTDPGYLQRTNLLGPVDKPHRVQPVRESKGSLAEQDGLPDAPALLLAQLVQAPDGFEPLQVFAMACGLATTVGRRAEALCALTSQEEGAMAKMLRLGLRAASDPLRLLDEQDLPSTEQAKLLALAYEIEGVLDARSAPRQREALQARPQAQRELAMPLLLRHGRAWLQVD